MDDTKAGARLAFTGMLAEDAEEKSLSGTGSFETDDVSVIDKPVELFFDFLLRLDDASVLADSATSSAKGAGPLARAAAIPSDAAGSGTNISVDGNTIVGYVDDGFDAPYHAFRWTEAAGFLDLGTLDPASNATKSSAARDVSADGSVVVGFSDSATVGHAFRWTELDGMVDLGSGNGDGGASRAFSVSSDGAVVVGESEFPPPDEFSSPRRLAFLWTEATGIQSLGSFESTGVSIATAVTADSAVVVGRSSLNVPSGSTTVGRKHAFRWTEAGGMQDLGVLPGDDYSSAVAVSDDGSIVIGVSSAADIDNNGVSGALRYDNTQSHAFYWTEADGMRDLTQLLSDAGADTTDEALVAVTGMTRDGKWIAAVTTRPDSEFPELYLDELPVIVSLTETLPPPSRLANLSTRGQVLTGDNVLIPGFVISGPANKKLLIRAVGPKLADFGVASPLGDPMMALKRTVGNTPVDVASNDNWGDNANAADIVTTSATLGAFALDNESTDAVLLVDLEPGQYTVVTQGASAGTGVAIAELYDADAPSADSKLVNISTRGFVGTGESIMIPGYVVSNDSSLLLLVRAVGPTLGTFGVSGALENPQLRILRQEPGAAATEIATNDDWGSVSNPDFTASAAATAGAFALPEGSKDAALVIRLLPGIYTVQASGVGGATGVALVEVYALE